MATTYYIDFNRGDDNNAGTAENAPWKTLFKMDDAAKAAGDLILLADDSVWNIGHKITARVAPGVNWTGTKASPVTIGKYSPSSQSTGQYPIITNYFTAQASDWTYSAPNNAWVLTSPTTYAWQRSALCRINGTWNAQMCDLGDLVLPSHDYAFNVDSADFYLYAPATINPSDYYGEILLSAGGGVFHFQSGRNWITLQDIEFQNTGTGILVNVNGTGILGVNLRNVRGRVISGLIRPVSTAAAATGLAEIDIGHCDIEGYGMCAFYPTCTDGVAKLDIHHNRIKDGTYLNAQGAIYSTAAIENGRTRIFDNVISKVRFGTRYHIADGCGIYTDIGSNKVDVFRNIIYDAYLPANDNGGGETKWWSNIFYNVYSGFRLGDGQPGVGVPNTDHTFVNNTVVTSYTVAETLLSQYSSGLPLTGWRCSETINTIPSVTLRNNILYNRDGLSADAGILTPINVTSETYENNAVHGYAAVATINKTPWTAVATTNTLTDSPDINGANQPNENSPVIGSGIHNGYRLDAKGNQFWNPPSMGAIEYERPRTART